MGPTFVFCCSSAPRIPLTEGVTDRQTDGRTDGRTDRHNKQPLGLLVSNALKLSSGLDYTIFKNTMSYYIKIWNK